MAAPVRALDDDGAGLGHSTAEATDAEAFAATPRDDSIRSLERGLQVVLAFDAEHPTLTMSEVASRAGLTRSGARRALHTLVTLGYATLDGRAFRLTPRLLDLGFERFAEADPAELLTRHLRALSLEVHETASASVLVGSEIAYVARVATQRILRLRIQVGTRFPAESASMGRVLLAWLPPEELQRRLATRPLSSRATTAPMKPDAVMCALETVREQGYAISNQEFERGLFSVAVPVRDHEGAVRLAVNVAQPATDDPDAALERVLAPLQRTAAAIEADLAPLGCLDEARRWWGSA